MPDSMFAPPKDVDQSTPLDVEVRDGDGELESSVIVAAFNVAQILPKCLEALLDQSIPGHRYEVLVVDDGSTDATVEVASRYPVRLISQSHSGAASARNLGAKEARGKYLLFADADAVPAHDWIEEVIRPLRADSRVAGVKGVCRTNQASLVAQFYQVEFEEKYDKLRRSKYIDFIDTGSAAYRKQAFWDGGGFNATLLAAEDIELSFNLASMGNLLVFSDKAVVYHQHPATLSRYLSRKFRFGYWRTRVYRKYPGKAMADSYTPRTMRVQMASAPLLLCALALQLWLPAAMLLLVFLLSTAPCTRRAARSSPRVALAAPFILMLRALALELGLFVGLVSLGLAIDNHSTVRQDVLQRQSDKIAREQ